uniref:Bestrophin homolog n=1 Tax=Romanomermis culicivorax TaxID=13658 RepID=A0A915JWA0_ROMCU
MIEAILEKPQEVGVHDHQKLCVLATVCANAHPKRQNIKLLNKILSVCRVKGSTCPGPALVYSYFLACLFGRQYLLNANDSHDRSEADMYFPLFTLLQFVFYMGWLKVAESIMNPLGEDDDDFEVNYLIERNMQVSYFIVDDNCMKIPPLKRDRYWNDPDTNVPHTQESLGVKVQPYVPSAVPESAQTDFDLKSSQPSLIITADSGANGPKHSLRSFRQYSNGSFNPSLKSLAEHQILLMQPQPSTPDATASAPSKSASILKRSFRRLLSTPVRKLSRPEILTVTSRPSSTHIFDANPFALTPTNEDGCGAIYFHAPNGAKPGEDAFASLLEEQTAKRTI